MQQAWVQEASKPIESTIIADSSLSLFQKVLLTTDGTVTQMLEIYAGEPIRVHRLSKDARAATGAPVLHPLRGGDVLQRRILLRGARQNYLYAESSFDLKLLPVAFRTELTSSDVPIGLLWRREKMQMYREIVAFRREPNPELAAYFEVAANVEFLARTYVIHYKDGVLGVINESFPMTYFRE
jgi:chorismate-pyruvate lyase